MSWRSVDDVDVGVDEEAADGQMASEAGLGRERCVSPPEMMEMLRTLQRQRCLRHRATHLSWCRWLTFDPKLVRTT